jgi:8-oxo-dGTP pyrophosphatase MutT (NUDIX family)
MPKFSLALFDRTTYSLPSRRRLAAKEEQVAAKQEAGRDSGPLGRDEVRRRLSETCSAVDLSLPSPEPGTPAGVLIGLLGHSNDPQVILTRRTAHLKNHAAEISLPGGRVEAGDAGPEAAALREAFEEIGLAPNRVDVLGCLPPYLTVSQFRVYPFVGWIDPPLDYVIDANEVEEVFEIPLSFVLDATNHRWESAVFAGQRHGFYVLDYPGHRIWGATAGILVNLAEALR